VPGRLHRGGFVDRITPNLLPVEVGRDALTWRAWP
jgi:hypothetical protein